MNHEKGNLGALCPRFKPPSAGAPLANRPGDGRLGMMMPHAWKLNNRTAGVARSAAGHGHPQRHARFLFRRRAVSRSRSGAGPRAGARGRGRRHPRPWRRIDPARREADQRGSRTGAHPARPAASLQGRLAIPLSVDTWKAPVAEAALQEGAEIINDISAGRWDLRLWPTVAKHRAGYVLMHALDQPGHDAGRAAVRRPGGGDRRLPCQVPRPRGGKRPRAGIDRVRSGLRLRQDADA